MSEDEAARVRATLDGYYHDIFEVDKRGHAIYEDLYARFAAHAKVHTDGGIDAVLKTYKSAAMREVIEYIVTRVNRGAGVPDLQPPQENDDDLP
jgi:hypothetical protein